MKRLIAFAVAMAAMASFAVVEVQVGDWAIGGTCAVSCHGRSDGWRLSAEALPSETNGISLVRVQLESGQSAKRPVLSVKVRIPGGEARWELRDASGRTMGFGWGMGELLRGVEQF